MTIDHESPVKITAVLIGGTWRAQVEFYLNGEWKTIEGITGTSRRTVVQNAVDAVTHRERRHRLLTQRRSR